MTEKAASAIRSIAENDVWTEKPVRDAVAEFNRIVKELLSDKGNA